MESDGRSDVREPDPDVKMPPPMCQRPLSTNRRRSPFSVTTEQSRVVESGRSQM